MKIFKTEKVLLETKLKTKTLQKETSLKTKNCVSFYFLIPFQLKFIQY